jgi:predicted phosphodiesterase
MQGGPPLKIVAISDTHSHFDQFEQLIQHNIKGDIFICAGDFTRYGREEHFVKFFSILEQLQFRHKIVIAGNHEIALDNTLDPKRREKILEKYPCKVIMARHSSPARIF